jgi:signal transduction histidine kinase
MSTSGSLVAGRLRALVEAGIAVSSELSLDGVLQRIIEAAAELTGARYAALGVIDRSGTQLERFLTTGLSDAERAAIGDPPHGRGILGVLISDAAPLRLHDLSEDPRAVGFPPNHPLMRSFLGVPIVLRGVAYGNLYLTEKDGGDDFTAEDEELTLLLASQAAVAIENARLYESATGWLRQLESLNEVANALVGEMDLPRLLHLIAERLRELLHARLVAIMLPDSEGTLRIEAVDGSGAEAARGLVTSLDGSKAGAVLRRRRSERVDSLSEDLEVDQEAARRLGATSGLYVPLVVRERAIGVIAAHDRLGADPRFTEDDLRLAETFGSRAAVAADLSQRVASDALRRVVEAQELERRRLARELHDETGQALTSILLGLRSVEDAPGPDEARAAAASLRELVVSTLQDVRRLAVELRPRALDDFGLVPALERLVQTYEGDTRISIDLEAQLGADRLPPEIETLLYRTVQESLTNVVKHAQARRVSIVLTRRATVVAAVIEDDGRGFDPAAPGEGVGLLGMGERLALLGGRLQVESAPDAGTTLVVEVPIR